MTAYHVAQCNIGRVLAPLDTPELAGFVAALEPINRMVDDAPGFVWRLADAYLVLWWVPRGHFPTVVEARERLEALRRDDPTPGAFTFRSPFRPPDASRAADPVAEGWFCPT
jgi:Domain of unknown function (DUF3291)